MNIPTLWRALSRNCYQAMTKIPKQYYDWNSLTRGMHYLCSNNKSLAIASRMTLGIDQSPELLRVKSLFVTPSCGFKVRGMPKLRCKDCYFVIRQERRYVFCKSKPRHKQMAMKASPKKSWILSHATQGPQRAW